MLRTTLGISVSCAILAIGHAQAQYTPVDPIPLGQTASGVMANKLSGEIAEGATGSNSVSSRCFADSGPGPERRAMEAEYRQRMDSDGKASAEAWRAQHGRDYRAALVKSGKC